MIPEISTVSLIVNDTVTITVNPSINVNRRETFIHNTDNGPNERTIFVTSNIASLVQTRPELITSVNTRSLNINSGNRQSLTLENSGTITSNSRSDNFLGKQSLLVDNVSVTNVDNIFSHSLSQLLAGSFINFGNVVASNITNYSHQLYSTPGTYTFTVPAGVTSISVMGVGGGGGGSQSASGGWGGWGGYTNFANAFPVTPGQTLTVQVGAGGTPSLIAGETGGDSFLRLASNNFPIVFAPGGPGGRRLLWNFSNTLYSIQNVTQTIANLTAISPESETITYSVISGSLPTNVTFNSNTGNLFYSRNLSVTSQVNSEFTISANTATQSITRIINLNISPTVPTGQTEYTVAGTYSWVAPAEVTSVCVVCVGGGQGGRADSFNGSVGGRGGGLGWKNNIAVVPGQSYTVVVGGGGNGGSDQQSNHGPGGDSYFISLATVAGRSGGNGGTYIGDGGGNGGAGLSATFLSGAGGGAGGYTGNGGNGASLNVGQAAQPGSGGGGGGGGGVTAGGQAAGSGGGVGIYGQGANGAAGANNQTGGAGSGGSGTSYGGGGGNFVGSGSASGFSGGVGAVRIIWGASGGVLRAFPATLTANIVLS